MTKRAAYPWIARLVPLVMAVAPAACGDPAGAGGDGGGEADGDGGAGRPDGGDREFPPDGDPAGCRKVDVVIAVDNSGSMQEEKAALRDVVFPAFARALLAVGGGLDDFRVGVLDACPDPAAFHTRGAGGACTFSGGQVWMESTSPDLAAEFRCVGDIDSGGSRCTGNNDDEQPASAAAASLEPPASTGPNQGYARDDALLVVVAITDEDEQPTPDRSAQEVHDRLVAAKGGQVERMVFLGIGGGSSCSGAYGGAQQAVKLKATTDLFIAEGRGVWWDLCQGRLEDGLTQAMAVIDEACRDLPVIP